MSSLFFAINVYCLQKAVLAQRLDAKKWVQAAVSHYPDSENHADHPVQTPLPENYSNSKSAPAACHQTEEQWLPFE